MPAAIEPAARDAAYEAGATALLLVDVQKVWLEPGHGEGSDAFFRHIAATVVPNQARLLDAARSAGVEVVYTIIRSLTAEGRDRSLDHKLSSIHVAPDDPNGDVVAALSPRADEIVLPKTSSGVFNSTNIDYVLRNLGVRFLIIAGVMTDQCVDMAVRDASDRGYLVTCVDDACAAASEDRHKAALQAFGGYCWIADVATVEARLRALSP
jgi:nicotinamidase-related amidase